MRFLTGLFLLAAAFTGQAQAQKLSDIDVKPGYLLVQCNDSQTDSIGALGLLLNKVSSSQTDQAISLTVNSSLFVCSIALDGSKKLSWKTANPFQGFASQYFDYATNAIQTRKVFIDPTKPFNRMSLVVLTPAAKLHSAEATMKEDANNSFTGTLRLKKSELLSASDLAQLNKGKLVKKTVELYHWSNFTTIVKHEEIQLEDEDRGGNNLIFHFKKEGQAIRLVKISN